MGNCATTGKKIERTIRMSRKVWKIGPGFKKEQKDKVKLPQSAFHLWVGEKKKAKKKITVREKEGGNFETDSGVKQGGGRLEEKGETASGGFTLKRDKPTEKNTKTGGGKQNRKEEDWEKRPGERRVSNVGGK